MPKSSRSVEMLPVAAITGALLWLGSAAVIAAPNAGAKAGGHYDFYGTSVHHSFTHARSHAETYQTYLRDTHGIEMSPRAEAAPVTADGGVVSGTQAIAVTPRARATGGVDAEVARDASDAIGDDIQRIQRHLDQLRKQAAVAGDTESLTLVSAVEKSLAVARRSHAALHEHHADETISPQTAMELTQKVNDSLRAAHAEHDKLTARLRPAR